MELIFLALLIVLMAWALGSGFPVAFALPGSAIITIILAGVFGYFFAGDASAYFAQGGPWEWQTSGVTNLRGVYWEVERDTLIAIPLFIFMGIMLQRSRIAEDLLVTMAQLFTLVNDGSAPRAKPKWPLAANLAKCGSSPCANPSERYSPAQPSAQMTATDRSGKQ